MLEVEDVAIENHGSHIVLLLKHNGEWREVARHDGRGSVRVESIVEAWLEGKTVEDM